MREELDAAFAEYTTALNRSHRSEVWWAERALWWARKCVRWQQMACLSVFAGTAMGLLLVDTMFGAIGFAVYGLASFPALGVMYYRERTTPPHGPHPDA